MLAFRGDFFKKNDTTGPFLMLIKLHKTLLLAQRGLIHNSKTALIIIAVVFFGMIAGTHQLQFLLSIDDLIDPDFATHESLKKVNDQFHDKNTILLSIESNTVFEKKYLCNLQTWILDTAQKRHDLIKIQSTFGIRQAVAIGQNLKMESFLDVNCSSPDSEKEKIHNAFEKISQSPWAKILSQKKDYNLTINFIVHDPKNKKFGSIDTKVVKELQKSFSEKVSSPNVQIYWGGITTYQSHLREALDFNFILNFLMLILALVLFRLFIGSWTAGWIFTMSVLFSLAITFGFMGYARIPVDTLTNSVGLMVLISSMEDFIFVSYGMLINKWSLKKALRKFLLPSFFTSLTTAIGFGSLMTSDLGIIRRFGLVSSAASILEWAAIFLFLPALATKFPKISNIRFNSLRIKLKDPFQKKSPRSWAFILVICVAASLFFISHLYVEDSPEDYFFKNHEVSKTSKHFQESRGWTNEASLVFSSKNSEEENRRLISEIRNLSLIETVENPYDNIDFITKNLDSTDKRMIESLIENSLISKRLISDQNLIRAQLFIKSMKMSDIRNLKDQTQKICNDKCEIVGSLISYNEFSDRVINTLFSSLGTSLILVSLIIFLIRGPLSIWETFSCILSSIWGPLAILSLFIIFNIPLFFVSCVCASVLVGLAGDNAIQFIFSARDKTLEKSVESLADASLIISVTMIILTAVLLLSPLASLAKLGLLMMLGLALCYLGDLWILRGLLKK